MIWRNHHAVFGKIVRLDRTIQWWNLLLLLTVAFTPLPNAACPEYLRAGPSEEPAPTAVALYAFVFALSTIPWVFIRGHVGRNHELLRSDTSAAVEHLPVVADSLHIHR